MTAGKSGKGDVLAEQEILTDDPLTKISEAIKVDEAVGNIVPGVTGARTGSRKRKG